MRGKKCGKKEKDKFPFQGTSNQQCKESSADSPRRMDLAILPVFYLNSAKRPYNK